MSFANDIDFFSLKPYHIKRKQGEFTYQIFLMGVIDLEVHNLLISKLKR